ncbi:MAG: sensor histidine kinase [Chloroflexota bacterium]|nr:sensor histidine kinase [Chloroflexota bacterium]
MAGASRETVGDAHSARSELLIMRAGDIAVYSTAVLGYFYSLQAAYRLTAGNVLAFTAINIAYAVATWATWRALRTLPQGHPGVALGMLVVCLLAFASGLMHATGIEFDWLLYFATVGMAIVVLPMRAGLVVGALLYAAVLVTFGLLGGWEGIGAGWLTILSGFLFVGAFSFSNRLLTAERERSAQLVARVNGSNEELAQAHRQLQSYANELEELTIARERTRMAREIHDTLGHYLTILSIQLETISKLQERDPRQAAVEVQEARRVAAQSMQEVRNAVSALRPTGIATQSLAEAITQLGDDFRRVAPGTDLVLDLDAGAVPLLPDLQLALYRAAQETLTNVRKHSTGDKVLLRVRHEDGYYEMLVLDNGTAPEEDQRDQPPRVRGFGLLGLRERIELLGGEVTAGRVESPARGYRVAIRVPGEALAGASASPVARGSREATATARIVDRASGDAEAGMGTPAEATGHTGKNAVGGARGDAGALVDAGALDGSLAGAAPVQSVHAAASAGVEAPAGTSLAAAGGYRYAKSADDSHTYR